MTLAEAAKVGETMVLLVGEFCERIEIAGSIRRQRPECNDVDLVAIPKWRVYLDLLGCIERRENLLRSVLVEYVRQNRPRAAWVSGVEPAGDGINFSVLVGKTQVDIFCAGRRTWATKLILRTGSLEHNKWISNRCLGMRGQFLAAQGLWLPYRRNRKAGDGDLVQPESEAEFYRVLGLPYIEPENREWAFLARLETELAVARRGGAACP